MTSYLIKSGAMPFTGAEICAELGISEDFALTLDDLIAEECCNSAQPVLASVWRVTDGPRFDQESLRGGKAPIKVSEPFEWQGDTYRECTYVPHAWAVDMVRKRVIAKARASEDVNLDHAIRDADAQKAAEARATLKDQLTASLDAEVAYSKATGFGDHAKIGRLEAELAKAEAV